MKEKSDWTDASKVVRPSRSYYLAAQHDCRSIAFPPISMDAYGFPIRHSFD